MTLRPPCIAPPNDHFLLDRPGDRVDHWDLFAPGPVLLSSDAGAIRVRRRIEAIVANEQELAPSPALR